MTSPSLDPAMADFATLWDYPLSPAYHGMSPVPLHERESFTFGTARPKEPVRIERHMGRKTPSDVVWIDGGIRIFAVSARVAALLDGATGWEPYPVDLYDGHGVVVPGFVGVAITGRGGPLRVDLTRVEGQGRDAEYVGLWLARDTWDGSDLFFPSQPGRVIPVIAGRLARALRKARLGGAQVTPLPEFRSIKASVDRGIEQGRELGMDV